MNRLIIFDLDGTIVDTRNLHFETLNIALFNFDPKYVISHDLHLSKYDGLNTTKKLAMLTEEKGLPITAHQKIWEDKQAATFELIKKLPFDHKINNLFKTIKNRGWKIAVASNSIRETVKLSLLSMGVMEYVDLFLSNEDVKRPKPFPSMFWKAMEELNAIPTDTLIVEDSSIGRTAALNSGAHLIAVENAVSWTEDEIFTKMDEIENKAPKNIQWRDKKLNVLIPMAGAGSRFADAGYTFPKPLIEVRGKPMIQVVVDNLNIEANYIFICQREHYQKFNLQYMLQLIAPGCKIVLVDGLTEGAACTTLLAKSFIDNDSPLVMANSDQFVEWNSNEVMYAFKADDIDGGILTFSSMHPKWSYTKLDENGFVKEVAEKKVISNHATCFHYDQSIKLVDGRSFPIGQLVNEKIKGEVLSFNIKTKTFETKKIINWIKNDDVETEWYDVSFKGAPKTNNGKGKIVRATQDHKFLTEKGYIRADNLTSSDKLLTSYRKPNKIQQSIINGTILGDGHYKKPNKFGEQGRLSFKHSMIQKDWFYTIVAALSDLSPSIYIEESKGKVVVENKSVNHNGSLTAVFSANPFWAKERNRWYPEGVKIIPEDLLLDDITLAVWYMDDGSLLSDKSSAILCTDSFDDASITRLIESLNNIGIYVSKQKKKSGYRLAIYNGIKNNTEQHFSSDEFFNRIARYIPPCMQYKIPELFRGRYENWTSQKSDQLYLEVEVKKSNIITKREKNSTKNSYCIEVEDNHNFITCDMVVSNCGIYYWKHGSDYVKYAEQMIAKDIRVNGEFYTAPTFNEAIADGKKIKIKEINQMWGLGVPEDLNTFLAEYKGKV